MENKLLRQHTRGRRKEGKEARRVDARVGGTYCLWSGGGPWECCSSPVVVNQAGSGFWELHTSSCSDSGNDLAPTKPFWPVEEKRWVGAAKRRRGQGSLDWHGESRRHGAGGGVDVSGRPSAIRRSRWDCRLDAAASVPVVLTLCVSLMAP